MKRKAFTILGAVVVMLSLICGRVQAEENTSMNALQTALSSTTISGYVDTSVEWSTPAPQLAPAHLQLWWGARCYWCWMHGWRW